MEQIEWKGYYWGYKAMLLLLFLVLIWGRIGIRIFELGTESTIPLGTTLLWICGAAMMIESGRFLYSCYHGTQEFSDRYSGKHVFLVNGISAGLWGLIGLWGIFGLKDLRTWLVLPAGAFFYWLICHLAYLRYALLTEEESEEKEERYGKALAAACCLLLVLYYGAVSIGMLFTYSGDGLNAKIALTEEEQGYLEKIEEGKKRCSELEYTKMDCYYFTGAEEAAPIYQDGGIAHACCWASPGSLYTQILDPEESDRIYRECYRDTSGRWHIAADGTWIPEEVFREEWINLYPEDNTGETFEPSIGSYWWSITPETVESIKQERLNGQTIYTVQYNSDYKILSERLGLGSDIKAAAASERYTLNEYGVLTAYELEEQRLIPETGKTYTERTSFRLLSVNQEEIREEITALISQYPQTFHIFRQRFRASGIPEAHHFLIPNGRILPLIGNFSMKNFPTENLRKA